ncbi:MAG: hypothetical protein IKU43_09585 [Clostridia bacterium]|nr:hypothetical protein [Clostridia bacterium]
MKTLLLIGDSIRMGYDKSVRKTLDGIVNVYFPGENCRFASYLLRNFHEYFKEFGINGEDVDVIHWNAGLWDCLRLFGEDVHTPVEIYKYYIDRLCARIVKLCPNAKVIFATSTRVLSEKMSPDFKRYNEEIEEYNKAALEVVAKYGFEVDDLYALSASLPEAAHSDAVHYYTPVGTEAFTNKVLSYVVPALGLDGEFIYKEDMYTDAPIGI